MFTISEIFGEPETGKTHNAHEGWPSPLHIDTAVTKLSVAEHEVKVRDSDGHGESWGVISSLYDWDEDEAEKHYVYATSFDGVRQAVIEDGGKHGSVILDNTYDLRSLAIKEYLSNLDGRTWINQMEYGAVNEMVDELTGFIKDRGYHVVWVSQMDDEYRNDTKTGERVPKSPKMADHRTDFRLEFDVADGEREITVRKNRHMDPTSDEIGARGSELGGSVSLEELLIYSDVPSKEWEI